VPSPHTFVPDGGTDLCADCAMPEPNRQFHLPPLATPPEAAGPPGTPNWTAWHGPEDGAYDVPVLPYAGTSGYSGSVTSEERARRDDADGTTSHRQAQVVAFLAERQGYGATFREVGERFGWHHGQSSGVLSVLHKAGRIDRLAERRDRCEVYVLPAYVDDRETRQHGRRTPVLTDIERRAFDSLQAARRTGAPFDRMDVATVVAALDRLL
jgi:hypothetical protein